jgi:hypothetical protein
MAVKIEGQIFRCGQRGTGARACRGAVRRRVPSLRRGVGSDPPQEPRPEREMPKQYGTRLGKIRRHSGNCPGTRGTTSYTVLTRIDLGPSRRDPQGPLSSRSARSQVTHDKQRNALQGASAKGSFVVTRRVSRRVSANASLRDWFLPVRRSISASACQHAWRM